MKWNNQKEGEKDVEKNYDRCFGTYFGHEPFRLWHWRKEAGRAAAGDEGGGGAAGSSRLSPELRSRYGRTL